MHKLYFSIILLSLAVFSSRTASAQQANQRNGFGVGAEVTVTGIVGAAFVYDPGPFHVDALLAANFAHNDQRVGVAGRLFFPLHRSRAADFSIGPGLGLVHVDNGPTGNPPVDQTTNELHLEGAAQIRAFIVSNVALSASAGLGVVFRNGDNNNSAVIGGQVGAALGITYFFF